MHKIKEVEKAAWSVFSELKGMVRDFLRRLCCSMSELKGMVRDLPRSVASAIRRDQGDGGTRFDSNSGDADQSPSRASAAAGCLGCGGGSTARGGTEEVVTG
jgi:hypothetical protein